MGSSFLLRVSNSDCRDLDLLRSIENTNPSIMIRQLIGGLFLLVVLPSSLACIRGVSRDYDAGYPSFCKGLECPEYELLNTLNDRTEERLYRPSKWVGTEVRGMQYSSAMRQGFMRLFDYISGENDAGQKIEMTAPVVSKVIPGQGSTGESSFFMYFYVPAEHQESTPNPSNPDVFFKEFPEFRAYVRSFGGFASHNDYTEHAAELSTDLDNAGMTYEHSYFYTAGYDSPYTFFYRHNEVWYVGE